MKLDNGFKESEKLLIKLEKEIHIEYQIATKEMMEKCNKYFMRFSSDDAEQSELFKAGKITKQEYADWRKRKMLQGKQYTELRHTLAKDLTNVDRLVMSYANNKAIDVYALNMNFGTYLIEKEAKIDTSFTLYNRSAVERLIKNQPNLLPIDLNKTINIPKDMRWNMQHIDSAITQAILQGKPIPQVAKSLQKVTGMDERAAIRNARTTLTGAQNGGRLASMERMNERGVKVKKAWLATLDDRTRDSHALLDGEEREIDEEFSNGLMFPADSEGEPAEIYNCRCRMVHVFDKYKTDWSDLSLRNTDNMGDMSYAEWRKQHERG